MSKNMQNYNKTIRHVVGKVDMNFYENTSDNDADVMGSFEIDGWREFASKQLISAGLEPKHKYASIEGCTYLDGSFYLYPETSNIIIPLWSTQRCDANKQFDTTNPPVYILELYNKRKVNSMKLIGDIRRNEFPLEYEISLYTLPEDEIEDADILSPTSEYVEYAFNNIPTPIDVVDNGTTYKVYTFSVNPSTPPSTPYHYITFGKNYQAYKITLKILKWNVANTTAKIMFFSNETKAIFENDQLASIKVLEEKSTEIEELSYGISSNTCDVKVSNENDRFTKNPDLLKKNRIIKPFIKCKEDEEWDALGTFYSDSWEVSSTSKYVTCKAYDILYNLQKIYIYYEMQGGSTLGQNYTIEQNKSFYDVFTKVGELINLARMDAGIYGADIKFVVDERLKNHTMPYVLIGYDTAWNILKELANQSLSFIYVDRNGDVQIVRDELGTDRIPETVKEEKTCSTQITEKNAFSYNLPTMSRTVVNRVKVPYYTLEAGEENDNKFEIKAEDISYTEEGNKKISLDLKNFYPVITQFNRIVGDNSPIALNAKSIRCCYNRVEIIFNENDSYNEFSIMISSDNYYKLTNQTLQTDNIVSQKRNGIVEFELDASNVSSKTQATEISNAILSEYADGKPYIETDWRGNPEISLGTLLNSRSNASESLARYEILSNEITLENGLKFNSQSRQNLCHTQ